MGTEDSDCRRSGWKNREEVGITELRIGTKSQASERESLLHLFWWLSAETGAMGFQNSKEALLTIAGISRVIVIWVLQELVLWLQPIARPWVRSEAQAMLTASHNKEKPKFLHSSRASQSRASIWGWWWWWWGGRHGVGDGGEVGWSQDLDKLKLRHRSLRASMELWFHKPNSQYKIPLAHISPFYTWKWTQGASTNTLNLSQTCVQTPLVTCFQCPPFFKQDFFM